MNILDFNVSSAVDNCVVLCPACHRYFDNNLNPGWVFFPSDLKYFIDFELADRRARVASPRPRIVPNSGAYLQHLKDTSAVQENAQLPLYDRHVLRPEVSMYLSQITDQKAWHGHPIAAIRNAWRALGSLRGNRIPLQQRGELAYLLELYRSPPEENVPLPAGMPPPPPPSDDQEPGDDTGKGKGKGKQMEKRGTKRALAPKVQQTLAGKRTRRETAGTKKKGRALTESVVGSETRKHQRANPDIIQWLDEVQDEVPPTAPPTPERG